MKTKVEIPVSEGRSVFGILDETGILQSGEVFVQYSADIKRPGKNLRVHTVSGP